MIYVYHLFISKISVLNIDPLIYQSQIGLRKTECVYIEATALWPTSLQRIRQHKGRSSFWEFLSALSSSIASQIISSFDCTWILIQKRDKRSSIASVNGFVCIYRTFLVTYTCLYNNHNKSQTIQFKSAPKVRRTILNGRKRSIQVSFHLSR